MLNDLRYAFRQLTKNPGFTAVAVLTLALGIGANTAIFSVVDATLSRGLPYHDPERLVHLWETTPRQDFARREASYPDYLDWKQNEVFSGVAAYAGCGFVMTSREGPEPVPCAQVSANFFSVLGVQPILGRAFQTGEDNPGGPKVVMVSYDAWQRRFGGDHRLLGQALSLNGEPWTVIGILPPSFHFAPRGPSELWAPLVPDGSSQYKRHLHWVNIIARLKPDVSLRRAETEMKGIGHRISEQYRTSHTGTGIQVEPLQDEIIGSVKPLMLSLFVAVGLVLLIACANVANLMLARGATRYKEIAVRLALGAGRWRVVRQLLTECLLFSLLGGAIGLLLAQYGVELLVKAIPDVQLSGMPYLRDLSMDGRVLVFASGLTVATSLLFGLAPALQAGSPVLRDALSTGSRTSSTSSWRLRQLLVVAEIAVSLVLLIGTGLMLKSFRRLLQVDPGFNSERAPDDVCWPDG